MLQKIILQCEYAGDQKASYQWGSIFHGVLIDNMPSDIADYLHQIQLRPFSQYILPNGEKRIDWHIGLWDDQVSDVIIKNLMSLKEIYLKQKGLYLKVVGSSKHSLSLDDYFSHFFGTSDICRRFEIIFLTPCTHKQYGRYTMFPSPELIIQSLSMRYNAFSNEYSLDDAEAMAQIASHLRIVRYSLRSAVYYLEKTKITGYTGRITLAMSGPEQLARLAGALISFAEYSGLGIKTALGMGGIKVAKIPGQ